MEKNLSEHSKSFSHKEQDTANDTESLKSSVPAPAPEPEADPEPEPVVDSTKPNEESKNDDHVEEKPKNDDHVEENPKNDDHVEEKPKADDHVEEEPKNDDHVEEEPHQEPTDHNNEDADADADATVEVLPEIPPPNLEKVSEDIDQFLISPQPKKEEDKQYTFEIPDFLPLFLELLEQKISKYETGEAKWGDLAEEDSFFLESVNRVSKLLRSFTESPNREGKEEDEEPKGKKELLINSIGSIQQRALSFLEEQFRLLLEESRHHNKLTPKGKQTAESFESESPSETVIDFPSFTEETVTNLSKIAKEMIAGGYEKECCQVFALSRRHAFEENLHKQGYEKISIDEVQRMQWETLEREIPTWINTFKESITVWFPGERKLTESVFSDEPSTAASLFEMLYCCITIQLLNFAESVAMTKRAGEKLFKLLDMYETLRDAIPNMDNSFPDGCAMELKTETTSAKCRLGEAAVLIFCDLENSIKAEIGKTPVAGGAVHPLTRYIMNYLRLACEYKDTLEEVFKVHSKIERADSTSRPRHAPENQNQNDKEDMSPFAAQLMRVMELLDENLEGKAKLYKDVALSCIFMMNNGRYIVQKIKGSTEIYQVMGETWCRKRSTGLRTYHKNYQVETWSKILSYLSLKGLSDYGKVHKPALKERFKCFNALFEEIHKTQCAWVVSDEQLQTELRVSVSALVIPAYRSFLGRYGQYLDPGRQTEKYMKYQVEDIETCIDELFDGTPHHLIAARKKA
ncbi:hypothetical protein RJT34_26655 [Clitoria ternatea]|uniref:Exocyst subunit Exo70 family protein n=1 Tax=Clitoria ternatea TaxID=43366 RepID=A0AAN9I858_CLITE